VGHVGDELPPLVKEPRDVVPFSLELADGALQIGRHRVEMGLEAACLVFTRDRDAHIEGPEPKIPGGIREPLEPPGGALQRSIRSHRDERHEDRGCHQAGEYHSERCRQGDEHEPADR
jgi:hypothetical protein